MQLFLNQGIIPMTYGCGKAVADLEIKNGCDINITAQRRKTNLRSLFFDEK